MRDLADVCGPDRLAAVCRELTKLHEEVRRGPIGELAIEFAQRSIKGEVAIVVAGSSEEQTAVISLEAGRRRVEVLVAEGVKRSAAARLVAEETGLPRRELFAIEED